MNWQGPGSSLQQFANSCLDFVFPPMCISCNNHLEDGQERVCRTCWNSIQSVTRRHPLFIDTREKLLAGSFVSDLVSRYVFEKEGAFQQIAHGLKYQGFKSLGIALGRRIGEQMRDWGVAGEILIPIPLHKIKFRERGYNQAEMIARGISEVTGIQLRADIVGRKKHTQTQTQLNLEERTENLEEAFEIATGALVENRICVVVDDVITTGATINSCASELLKAGATRVVAVSAALAQKGAA
jgi:ComF family protein